MPAFCRIYQRGKLMQKSIEKDVLKQTNKRSMTSLAIQCGIRQVRESMPFTVFTIKQSRMLRPSHGAPPTPQLTGDGLRNPGQCQSFLKHTPLFSRSYSIFKNSTQLDIHTYFSIKMFLAPKLGLLKEMAYLSFDFKSSLFI